MMKLPSNVAKAESFPASLSVQRIETKLLRLISSLSTSKT